MAVATSRGAAARAHGGSSPDYCLAAPLTPAVLASSLESTHIGPILMDHYERDNCRVRRVPAQTDATHSTRPSAAAISQWLFTRPDSDQPHGPPPQPEQSFETPRMSRASPSNQRSGTAATGSAPAAQLLTVSRAEKSSDLVPSASTGHRLAINSRQDLVSSSSTPTAADLASVGGDRPVHPGGGVVAAAQSAGPTRPQ